MKVFNWESKLFGNTYHIYNDKNTIGFFSGDSSDNFFGIIDGNSYSFVNNGNLTQIFENEGSKEVISIFCNNEKNQASFTYKDQPYVWSMHNGLTGKSTIKGSATENDSVINYSKSLFETQGQIFSQKEDPLLIFIGLVLRCIHQKHQYMYLMIFLPLIFLLWLILF